ncbi:MAG: radical SAM protein [Synergistaceae bacterium]|nr:radical SAM protein [Synergistaceae bacterium]
MGRKRIAFFMPGSGCGRKCVYCDQKVITRDAGTRYAAAAPEDARRVVSGTGAPVELCYFGGSFARIGIPLMTEFLDVIHSAAKGSSVTFSSYPGDFDGESGREIIRILKNYPIGTIELGIPSLDPKVLAACRRDDDAAMIIRAATLLRDSGFHVGVQLMMGLPHQTGESVLRDIGTLAHIMPGHGGWDFRLYPCLVLKGTELEAMFERGEYVPLELEDAVRTAGAILLAAEKHRFNVIRVGLPESESLKKSVIAGPYHPAFGELALSEKLALSLFDASPRGPWNLPHRHISRLTGHGGRGLRRLAELTGLTPDEIRLRLVSDADPVR